MSSKSWLESGAVWKLRWPPGLPIPNSPYGLYGRKAKLNLNKILTLSNTSTRSKEIWDLRMEYRLLELRVLSMWVVKERMLFSDNGRRSWKMPKRRGPRTDPCRTPKEMGAGSAVWQWMLTDWWITIIVVFVVTAILVVVSLSVVLGDCCGWIFCSHEKCTIIVTECSALQGWQRDYKKKGRICMPLCWWLWLVPVCFWSQKILTIGIFSDTIQARALSDWISGVMIFFPECSISSYLNQSVISILPWYWNGKTGNCIAVYIIFFLIEFNIH